MALRQKKSPRIRQARSVEWRTRPRVRCRAPERDERSRSRGPRTRSRWCVRRAAELARRVADSLRRFAAIVALARHLSAPAASAARPSQIEEAHNPIWRCSGTAVGGDPVPDLIGKVAMRRCWGCARGMRAARSADAAPNVGCSRWWLGRTPSYELSLGPKQFPQRPHARGHRDRVVLTGSLRLSVAAADTTSPRVIRPSFAATSCTRPIAGGTANALPRFIHQRG